ncbi:hypothetical protein EV640_107176 [Nesterenkonia aurantiaca]|uniref:Uncharacterized protein n=1 Tax=Nesterenkonia aurantiaca TaxID=1436010 RepID=A0A4R7G148_9MICC|nr:hypothetical protein EV640_107176 [Nesterenkonia aurantiaca]
METVDQSASESQHPARSFGVSLAAGSLLLTVLTYGFLIWSNCETAGIATFLGDVRSFHTAEGC